MPRAAKKVKLTTRVNQIKAELDKASAEFDKPEGSRDYAKAIGHLRLAQSLNRQVKDFVMKRETSEIRSAV